MAATNRQAIGNGHFLNGPTDTFATSDGWIVTQVVGDPLFRRWTRLLKEPHWLEDPRFATDKSRGLNGAILSERMARWCAHFQKAAARMVVFFVHLEVVGQFVDAVREDRDLGFGEPVSLVLVALSLMTAVFAARLCGATSDIGISLMFGVDRDGHSRDVVQQGRQNLNAGFRGPAQDVGVIHETGPCASGFRVRALRLSLQSPSCHQLARQTRSPFVPGAPIGFRQSVA